MTKVKLQKWTMLISFLICLISLTYAIAAEWNWWTIEFLPEHVNFFQSIALNIFGSSFLIFGLSIVVYTYEYRKTFKEIKKLFSLTLINSYNISNIEDLNKGRHKVKELHIRNCIIDFSPILSFTNKNMAITEMNKSVTHIYIFYISNEHIIDITDEKRIAKFNRQFNEWRPRFEKLDNYFNLKIL